MTTDDKERLDHCGWWHTKNPWGPVYCKEFKDPWYKRLWQRLWRWLWGYA